MQHLTQTRVVDFVHHAAFQVLRVSRDVGGIIDPTGGDIGFGDGFFQFFERQRRRPRRDFRIQGLNVFDPRHIPDKPRVFEHVETVHDTA